MTGLSSYQRGMLIVTASSLLVPVIGVMTAPILTHSLGVAGRGEAGAATAPNLLIVGVATLGLPQALTYHLAKRPHLTRVAVGWATLFSVAFGVLSLLGITHARDYLSDGDPHLAGLMLLGIWLALPSLTVGLLRGAATGRQMWTSMALERTLNGVFRLGVLGGLAAVHRLDVTSAVVVMCLAPLVGGLAYAGMLVRPAPPPAAATDDGRLAPDLLRFGFQVWLGSVAIELMGRMDQLLVTPLSSVEQLGLFIVAVNVSDVPYIVTQTVREVTFGASSAEADTERLLTTSRIASLLTAVASLTLGVSLPFWIGFVFGAGFDAAVVPTWILLASACLAVPGTIAGAGLDSAGRPALRSASLVLALVSNFLGLVFLVPPLGAVGAALAALLSTLASSVFVIVAASRVLHTAAHRFFAVRGADLVALWSSVRTVAGGLRPARNVP